MKKTFLLFIFLCLLSVFLYFSPQIDQSVAAFSFSSKTQNYICTDNVWCDLGFNVVPWIVAIFMSNAILILFLVKFIENPKRKKQLKRLSFITLMSLLLGPGLIVNSALKDHWGRPRPRVVRFEHKPYAPVWKPQFTETSDNSFPSGHAAIGFFLGVPFLALGYRKRGLLVGTFGCALIGCVRILQGGHFVSDVVFAGIFVWIGTEISIFIADRLFQKRV